MRIISAARQRLSAAFNIDEMIMTDCVSTSFFFEKLLNSLDERNVTVNEPPVGGVRNVGDMRVEFLAPLELGSDMNNNSIIMRVTFGEISAMFTGDAEEPAERELLSENVNLKSDILKVGHHGSRYSSSNEFLRAVSPKIAVIQSGIGNSYGHPHAEALSRLSACGAKVYRCDEQGTIVLKTDGKTITRGKPGRGNGGCGKSKRLCCKHPKHEISYSFMPRIARNKKQKILR